MPPESEVVEQDRARTEVTVDLEDRPRASPPILAVDVARVGADRPVGRSAVPLIRELLLVLVRVYGEKGARGRGRCRECGRGNEGSGRLRGRRRRRQERAMVARRRRVGWLRRPGRRGESVVRWRRRSGLHAVRRRRAVLSARARCIKCRPERGGDGYESKELRPRASRPRGPMAKHRGRLVPWVLRTL